MERLTPIVSGSSRNVGYSGLELQLPALVGEKPALTVETAAVSGKAPVRTDDSVAGNDDGYRVGAIRGAYSAHGGCRTDRARDISIRRGRAGGDGSQRLPDALLKGGAVKLDRQGVQRSQISCEVRFERADRARRILTPLDAL